MIYHIVTMKVVVAVVLIFFPDHEEEEDAEIDNKEPEQNIENTQPENPENENVQEPLPQNPLIQDKPILLPSLSENIFSHHSIKKDKTYFFKSSTNSTKSFFYKTFSKSITYSPFSKAISSNTNNSKDTKVSNKCITSNYVWSALYLWYYYNNSYLIFTLYKKKEPYIKYDSFIFGYIIFVILSSKCIVVDHFQ